jgi:hypothetical protein
MKFIKLFEDFDKKELNDLLAKAKHLKHMLNTQMQSDYRKEVRSKGGDFKGLSDDYKDYFSELTDDGWDLYLYTMDFLSHIDISKEFNSPFDGEKIFNYLNPIFEGIKTHFTQNGFNTHYQILFNGVPQCENNPKTHKNDIFVYKGCWDDELSRYFKKDVLSVRIKFYFI